MYFFCFTPFLPEVSIKKTSEVLKSLQFVATGAFLVIVFSIRAHDFFMFSLSLASRNTPLAKAKAHLNASFRVIRYTFSSYCEASGMRRLRKIISLPNFGSWFPGPSGCFDLRIYLNARTQVLSSSGPSGAMDSAYAYEAWGCGFNPHLGRWQNPSFFLFPFFFNQIRASTQDQFVFAFSPQVVASRFRALFGE